MIRRSSTPYVFISYARPDRRFAVDLRDHLRRRGLNPWLDIDGVRVRHFVSQDILRALDDALAVVVLLSEHSALRPWVRAEVREARRRRIPVVLVQREWTPLPRWAAGALRIFLEERRFQASAPASRLTYLLHRLQGRWLRRLDAHPHRRENRGQK